MSVRRNIGALVTTLDTCVIGALIVVVILQHIRLNLLSRRLDIAVDALGRMGRRAKVIGNTNGDIGDAPPPA